MRTLCIKKYKKSKNSQTLLFSENVEKQAVCRQAPAVVIVNRMHLSAALEQAVQKTF